MKLDRKRKRRREHDTKNTAEKKPKTTNVLEADRDSNTEENHRESTVVRKLNDEILTVDEAGNVYFDEVENTVLEFRNEASVGEPPVVPEDVMHASGVMYGSLINDPEEVCIEMAEENILYVDEVGSIFLCMEANTEFMESDSAIVPLVIIDDEQMYEKRDNDLETQMEIKGLNEETSIVMYGSLITYPEEETRIEVVEEDEENVEQSENIYYVDEVGGVFLSMDTSTKLIEYDSALPLEVFDYEERRAISYIDVETEMKIKRLKEEISSLEERIKCMESKAGVGSNL